MNTLVGRKKEKDELLNLYHSERAEFITVYGRRRVGKTFLVNKLFFAKYAFKVTAVLDINMQTQIRSFAVALSEYGKMDVPLLQDWFAAFDKLRALLERKRGKRKVVFFDEMPWFDTKGSRFIQALEHFWNGWAAEQKDIMLIVCGSAAS
jgi:AAA+ ATPase superfamily predicted ATPase